MTPHALRRTGQILVVITIGLFLVATLRPASTNTPLAGPWCVICGDHGTLDVLQNLAILLPAGMGAYWLGGSGLLTTSLGFALSTSVELLQFFVPGRDGAVGDVLANTLGCGLGYWLASTGFRVLRPARERVAKQALVAVTAWVAVVTVTVLALRPHADEPPYALIVPADGPERTFHGQIGSTRVQDLMLAPNVFIHARDLRSLLLADSSSITMTLRPAEPTVGYGTIARLAAGSGTLFAFAQDERDFVCSRRTFAGALRIRSPAFALRDAFPATPAPREEPAGLIELECTRHQGRVALRSVGADRRREGVVLLSPGMGWSLLVYGRLTANTSGFHWQNALWLVALALPLGCYGVITLASVSPRDRPRRAATIVVATLLTMLACQIALPRVEGLAPSPWWEVASSAAGLALGAMLGGTWRSRIIRG